MAYADFGNAPGLTGTAALQMGTIYPPNLLKSIDDLIGPHTGLRTYQGCFTSTEVTVLGGMLQLSGVVNNRANCPSDWDTSSNWWPAGDGATLWPTKFDLSAVQSATFTFTYGTVEKRMRLPQGAGLWPTNWLVGASCMQPSIPAAFMNGGYINSDGSAPGGIPDASCKWPWAGGNGGCPDGGGCGESDTEEVVDLYPVGGCEGVQNHMDYSAYVNCDSGAPPESTLAPWGAYCGQLAFVVPPPWITDGGDITSDFHTYQTRWYPGVQQLIVDGIVSETFTGSWISNNPRGLAFYMEVNYYGACAGPEGALFTAPELIDYVSVFCEPGQTCTVNHQ